MLESLDRAKATHEWTKDGGQFIPYPATWLNASGWEDDIKPGTLSEPCGWVGCRHRAVAKYGARPVCEPHLLAFRRGETP